MPQSIPILFIFFLIHTITLSLLTASLHADVILPLPFISQQELNIPCHGITPQANTTYYWTKDSRRLEVDGLSIQVYPGEGSLHFKLPQESDQGIYQCYAENIYGIAVSHKVNLTAAVLHTFPTPGLEPTVRRVKVGDPLKLDCQPPYSNPPAMVYWGHNKDKSKLMPLANDQRVSLDFNGNLYFSNVEEADEMEGDNYVCIADNKVLRIMVQGNDFKIKPRTTDGLMRVKPPKLMWKSGNSESAINGHLKKLKCIFSGYPTPRVRWRKENEDSLPSHVRQLGQELHFVNTSHNDEGTYHCSASVAGSRKTSSASISLVVEAIPRWRSRGLEDVVTSEDEDAVFSCSVFGSPKPEIQWFINGVPIGEMNLKEMRGEVEGHRLRFRRVTKKDFRVVQCLASNMHGALFKNAFLKILAEAPHVVEAPGEVKVARGQTGVLRCTFAGAPKPYNVWYKDKVEDGSDVDLGDKFDIVADKDLQINDAQAEDSGEYACVGKNKFGNETVVGLFVVLNKTKIVKKPKSEVVVRGAEVRFECIAETDPREEGKLIIRWLFEGSDIKDMEKEFMDRHHVTTSSFSISDAQVADTGAYTCIASNLIDEDQASFKLVVKDRPSNPYSVRVACNDLLAEVAWTPGSDNNEPTSNFTVFSNSSHDDPGDYTTGCEVGEERRSCEVSLYPFSNFTFHVVARNSLGSSDRSSFSLTTCSTRPLKPYHHPHLVCTVSRKPGTLVIIWKPMERKEHNGPNFHYRISYRKHHRQFHNSNEQLSNFTKAVMADWRQNEVVLTGQPVYVAYEIYVEAVNEEGAAEHKPKHIIGFSSQDVPLEAPSKLRYVEETLTSTSVTFTFVGVENDQEKLRGFFVGYELKYWKEGAPEDVRSEKKVLQKFKPCHDMPGDSRWRRSFQDDVQEISVDGLWPYTTVHAGVAVLNGAKASHFSNVVSFTTPEGIPDDIEEASVVESGSHHIKVAWKPPKNINGVFDGYLLSVKERGNHLSHSEAIVLDVDQHYKKLHGLQSEREYEVEVKVRNRLHKSLKPFHLHARTVAEAEPDEPVIVDISSGFDYANVTWVSSQGKPLNPAKNYVIEYKRPEDEFWSETVSEDEHNWLNVSALQHAVPYQFRVVALNNHGEKMVSQALVHVVGMKPEPVKKKTAMLSWLVPVILLLLLFLLFLVILIFYLCKRKSQTGHYKVSLKEQQLGVKQDEEATFDEFLRSENSTFRKGKGGSLEGSNKSSLEDDGSDSLGAYDDVDPSKFNEEGSFVDQAFSNGSLPNGGGESVALMNFKMVPEA